MQKYKLNDIIYFVHKNIVGKGKIDELILHYTQKENIIKYIIRPYGLSEFVTLDESEIYDDLQSAKEFAIKNFKENITKERIEENYNKSKQRLDEQLKKNLENFDELFENGLKELENVTEEFFENKEKNYQQALKNERGE